MQAQTDSKAKTQQALEGFGAVGLPQAAIGLWAALGYKSDKYLDLPAAPEAFFAALEALKPLNRSNAHVSDWKAAHFLFQLTNDEIPSLAYGQTAMTIGDASYQKGMIESFVFLAVELTAEAQDGKEWTRTQLAQITRELNLAFPMPVIVLFQYGRQVSIAVIDRRVNKRDASRDVIDRRRVAIIKDVAFDNPHRAHQEILNDLTFANVGERHTPSNFRDLYEAWIRTLSVQELNKRFYGELLNWFLWAVKNTTFPKGQMPDNEGLPSVAVIRLLTRLIFVWFIKEKGLVPDALFREDRLAELLAEPPAQHPNSSSYYKAILQNLFFATLNTEQKERGWKAQTKSQNSHYLIHSLYRYRNLFQNPDMAFGLFSETPFLNGGLFECLDQEVTPRDLERNAALKDRAVQEGSGLVMRVDGFSERADNALSVPNRLFFSAGEDVDLSRELHTVKKQKTYGLIDIFLRYKFTVEENTPIEEEVALDPELLGKVFENLLAFYNDKDGTSDQARKKSGSFYTPRVVVDYMVDEALIAYFETRLQSSNGDAELPDKLKRLLAFGNRTHNFTDAEVDALTAAIENLRLLDPACGSGAFPMGMLQKLVHVLKTLDPDNARWKAQNLRPLESQLDQAKKIRDTISAARIEEAEDAISTLDLAFSDKHYADYSRKLFLIEKCLFGVDIQPIAVQIAKLRFFISLVVSQKFDLTLPNGNITALPNLETKLVAADSLIPLNKSSHQTELEDTEIGETLDALQQSNERYFAARSTKTKRKYRERIVSLRDKLDDLLKPEFVLKQTSTKKAAQYSVGLNISVMST